MKSLIFKDYYAYYAYSSPAYMREGKPITYKERSRALYAYRNQVISVITT